MRLKGFFFYYHNNSLPGSKILHVGRHNTKISCINNGKIYNSYILLKVAFSLFIDTPLYAKPRIRETAQKGMRQLISPTLTKSPSLMPLTSRWRVTKKWRRAGRRAWRANTQVITHLNNANLSSLFYKKHIWEFTIIVFCNHDVYSWTVMR